MKMHEPIGKPEFAATFLRLPLGAYFILAGLTKLQNVQVFVETVKTFQIVPENLAVLSGILIPYLEVGIGGLIFLGLWTTLAASISSILLFAYIYSLGMFPHPGSELFNKDLILLGGSLSLLFSGPGGFSIDGFRRA